MATEKGDALLAEWKERLCLTEWRIKLVDSCDPEDMTLKGCAGCTDWTDEPLEKIMQRIQEES